MSQSALSVHFGLGPSKRVDRLTVRWPALRGGSGETPEGRVQVIEDLPVGGWVHRRRDLGGIVFLDLRDREGIIQVAVGPDSASTDMIERAGAIGTESVVLVEGEVVARPPDGKNPEMATGDVEVHATSLDVVGPAMTPAIPVARAKGEELAAEELRLRYRYLDLRRPELQQTLALRLRASQRPMSAPWGSNGRSANGAQGPLVEIPLNHLLHG